MDQELLIVRLMMNDEGTNMTKNNPTTPGLGDAEKSRRTCIPRVRFPPQYFDSQSILLQCTGPGTFKVHIHHKVSIVHCIPPPPCPCLTASRPSQTPNPAAHRADISAETRGGPL